EKQSKSLNNYIGLGHSPKDKFGRVMTLPDELIATYFRVYTDVSLDQVNQIEQDWKQDPMKYKKQLAQEIVHRYHGEKIAKEEREWFDDTFSKKVTPKIMPEIQISEKEIQLLELLNHLIPERSNSDIRRLVQQGG